MFIFALLASLQSQQEVRLLHLQGMLLTSAQVKITRSWKPDGRIEWQEETLWNDGRLWIEVKSLDSRGRLTSWTVNWKGAKDEKGRSDASWIVEAEDKRCRIVKTMYRGESMNVVRNLVLDSSAFSFRHLAYKAGSTPIGGEKEKCLLFIPGIVDAGQLHETEAVNGGDVEMTLKGQKVTAHKITFKAEPRNETWWLDDSGLPLRREFWTSNPASPHRVEVLK